MNSNIKNKNKYEEYLSELSKELDGLTEFNFEHDFNSYSYDQNLNDDSNESLIVDHKLAKYFNNISLSKKRVIVKCENISKVIKTKNEDIPILNDINLEINEGEITIILGNSGCGKTTLLNIISGIDKPSSGNVVIDNTNINNLNEKKLTKFRRENLSYIYQRYSLIPIITSFDNIRLGNNKRKISKEDEVFFDHIINKINIKPFLNKFPNELSGGQKQRIAIARALIKKPTLILCDEPTGALDSKTSIEVIDLLREINKEYNATIVMVTHDNSLTEIANKIVFLKDGKIDKIINNN